uniref:Phosphatidate cytidylyltransferase, mitochondrial n=3 Tax=Lygus hesperus TaxID=30085 RepID=A0A0A9W1X3_LYGHE
MAATKALVPVANQLAVVPTAIERILEHFPKEYFRFCFAYGSGVFPQKGPKVGKPMIDLIFAVHDSLGFHWRNLQMNPSHYSGVKHLGPRFISVFQEKVPCRVYFNTLVQLPEEDVVFKYGVVHMNDFVNDMLDWDYIYLAGRMHKPVKLLTPVKRDFQILDMALRQNLLSALHIGLLLLPEAFSERELYYTMANISYRGDFRMIFGEDVNKVSNIVDRQLLQFRKLYKPYLTGVLAPYVNIREDDSFDGVCTQDMSFTSRHYHLTQLPHTPMAELAKYWRTHAAYDTRNKRKNTEEAMRHLSYDDDCPNMLQTVLSRIVFRSSAMQSLKGIFSAGLGKSVQYSRTKIQKMMKSLQPPT